MIHNYSEQWYFNMIKITDSNYNYNNHECDDIDYYYNDKNDK